MKNLKKVLVGLDLTQMDKILIQKTIETVKVLKIEMVYFIHVSKDLTLPEEITKTYPDLMAPVDESIEKGITDAIIHAGFPEGVKFEVEAKEGNPLEKLLRWIKVKDVDLLIMGRKNNYKGSGSLAKRIAGKSPCSVLFITEKNTPSTYDNLLVPIDFSSYSHLSLEIALEIAKDSSTIKCLHLYEVPAGYTKTGKTHEEFAEIMLNNAKEHYQKFLSKHQLPNFQCEFLMKNEGKPKGIMEFAEKEGIDFIIIGSRGRAESAAILIGSVTGQLIDINNEIPMLILKKKGETMDFLEALFRV